MAECLIYQGSGADFHSILYITANPGATITATGEDKTFTAVADNGGNAEIKITKKGTYTITSSYSAVISQSVSMPRNGNYYVDVYLDPVFGTSNTDIVYSSNASLSPSAVDTGVCTINARNLTINNGVTVSANNRNSGIIIRCTGNCTINGTIQNIYAPRSHSASLTAYYPAWMLSNGSGGAGGSGGTPVHSPYSGTGANGGSGQAGRRYGGGYSGGGGGSNAYVNASGTTYASGAPGGDGGSATGITTSTSIFVGGQQNNTRNVAGQAGSYGGGGAGGCNVIKSSTLEGHGGAGGNGAGGNGASGTWYDSSTYAGGGGGGAGNYGGGVVIIYCLGNLTINGTINCSGSNGGNPGGGGHNGSPGGGGGGGRIYLMCNGTLSKPGTFNVNGGSAGTFREGTAGGNGGAGTRYYQNYSGYKSGAAPTSF